MKKILFLGLVFLSACFQKGPDGKLIFTEANSQKGFNFPFFLFIPDEMPTEKTAVLIVEPNNSGFADDDFQRHIEKAERIASRDFYMGNFLAGELDCPLLVPVFPRRKSTWRIYSHALDRDVMLQKGNDLERIDLQLINMIDDARSTLKDMGCRVDDQVFLTGFSASGSFVNRFAAIHPELVKGVAGGGVNGLLILPEDSVEGEALNFPLGVNDFDSLFNKPFALDAFAKTPQFLFMGQLDDNDAIPYEDGYNIKERKQVFRLLGEEMQPKRWEACDSIYQSHNINARIRTFENVGHEQPDNVKEEVLSFFRSLMAIVP
ncbi:alpha/beta hydrolase family protein [Marinilabilia rubra]|uniref:Alpha/beta hydrolase n=1 Tax=Marinilabilia rubra TaxID=2162893 RepID=A0A2U2B460_9BACT|nr:hypothetical protein [Marinilabilia rubra]PWD97827.1 hypothetical protein DDZ16_18735 [Marinilabilia rubra]